MKLIFIVFRETINFNLKRSKIMINKESLAKFKRKKIVAILLSFFAHTIKPLFLLDTVKMILKKKPLKITLINTFLILLFFE